MTEKYTFNFPTIIRFGKGVIDELGPHLGEQNVGRPLIVTDSVCSKLPFFQNILKKLEKNKIDYVVFDKIHKNPIKSDVENGVSAFLQNHCDGIVGIGGGAPIDVARAIALKAHHVG